MNKFKVFVITIMIVLSLTLYGNDYDFESGNIKYKILDINIPSVEMIEYNRQNDGAELTLPDYVEFQGVQFTVTSLGKRLFNNMGESTSNGIESIKLPSYLQSIGEECFCWNTGLKKIVFPNTLKNIGVNAFSQCENLKEFKLPKHLECINTYGMAGIGVDSLIINCENLQLNYGCFEDSKGIERVYVNGVASIPEVAFGWCSKIKQIILGASVSKVFAASFYDCKPNIFTIKSNNQISVEGHYYSTGGRGKISTYNPFVNGNDSTSCPVYVLSVPKGMGTHYQNNHKDWRFQYIQEYSDEQEIIEAGMIFPFTDGNNYMITLKGNENIAGIHSFKKRNSNLLYIPSEVEFDGQLFKVNSINGNTFREETISDIYVNCIVPFVLNPYSFSPLTYLTTTLHVPIGTLGTYKNTKGWDLFKKIVEEDINIPIFAESISIAPIEVFVGDKVTLEAIILPENTSDKTITWASDNPEIAFVNSMTGELTALAPGQACITASCGDVSGSCLVTINPILIESISLNPSTVNMEEGEQIQIVPTIIPNNATNKGLVWSSSDESVATVDSFGLISLIKKGSAIITASATDSSGASAKCAVVVTEYSGIEDILTDKNTYIKVFNFQGIQVYEGIYTDAHLEPDYYIVVCDGKSLKVKVE